MSKPKVPPITSGIVEGENDHLPMPGMPQSGSGGVLGDAFGAEGGDLGGRIGGLAGGAIDSQIGEPVGQAVGSAVSLMVGGALGRGGSDPLGDLISGGLGGPSPGGAFPGQMGGASQDYFPISPANPNSPTSGLGGGGGGQRPPSANSEWFTIAMQGGQFGVYSFHGREEAHKPYEFTVELVSKSASVDIGAIPGTPACLTITDRSNEKRFVHGLVREMKQLHTANSFTHYRAVIVPRLYFLGQITDCRIFQNMTVVEIIQKVLKEQGFTGDDSSFKVGQKLNPREYCVQYNESYLHFITRLCEEEGIFFYFTHKEDSHCVCFYDYAGGDPIPGTSALRYFQGSGQPADYAVISRLELSHKVNSNAAMYKEWNFTKPKLDLTVQEQESDTRKAPVPSGMLLERYRYPHIYDSKAPGTRYVKLEVERRLTFAKWIDCQADVCRFLPGHVFTVMQHPRPDVNDSWWVFAVEHEGEQPGVLQHEAPSDRGMHYQSFVRAIPQATRFVPQWEHPKHRVVGTQTAIVTGPKGEEIYPDKYGRVKVQFFWDREGKWDDKTTCWIRASQGWAGSNFGTMAIPRIGHEVIVSFLEGDPDRPLITGCVYHDINMPPYQLPENKTRTVFKSMSTPGEEGEKRGFNELRIEDKKGEEEIYVHAEKDVNVFVKNDWKEHILHDKHETVNHFRYSHIKEEEHVLIEKDRKQELKEKDYLTIHGDSHTEYKTKWLAKADDEIHLKAGTKVVMEAGADLTIKAGGAFIRLNPAGATIVGNMVNINSGGAPGAGTSVSMEEPEEALRPGESPKPKKDVLKLKDEKDALSTGAASPGKANGPAPIRSGYYGSEPSECGPYDSSIPSLESTTKTRREYLRTLPTSEAWSSKTLSESQALYRKAKANESALNMQKAVANADKLAQGKGVNTFASSRYQYALSQIKKEKSLLDKLKKVDSTVPRFYEKEAAGKDHWKTPEEFYMENPRNKGLLTGGDCEDHAIVKYSLLAQAGVPKENMKILAVSDPSMRYEPHALLVVDDPETGNRYYLDNYNVFPTYPKESYEATYYVDENGWCIFQAKKAE